VAQVVNTIVIERSIEDVFAFVSNPEANHGWLIENANVTRNPEGPIRVGTIINSIGIAGEREVTASMEVVEYDPNKRFGLELLSYEVLSSTNRWRVILNYSLVPTEEGIQVTQVIELGRRSVIVERMSSIRQFRWLAGVLQRIMQPPEVVYNFILRRIGAVTLSRMQRELQPRGR
jgi:uncharacterized protein YndB with AHSA1/START domain